MPDRNLDYAIRARDESAGVFERFRANIASANREARQSGDLQLERFLKGGGVAGIFTLGAEEVKKFGDAADKAFRGILDGTQTWGDALDGVLKNLPVFGQFYQAATSAVSALEDGAAAAAKWAGANDDVVRSLESVEQQIARNTASKPSRHRNANSIGRLPFRTHWPTITSPKPKRSPISTWPYRTKPSRKNPIPF